MKYDCMTDKLSIPQTGKSISDQNELISDLTIALWLVTYWETVGIREQGAKILLELINRPIETPASWIDAMSIAKRSIQKESPSSKK